MKNNFARLLVAGIAALSILLFSCNKEAANPVTKSFDVRNFNSIIAGDDHEINITKGSEFMVQANGDIADLNDLEMLVSNQALKISYPSYESGRKRVHFNITMPVLTAVDLSGACYGNISGFIQPMNSLNIKLSGAVKVLANAQVYTLSAEISGASKLTMNGAAKKLIAGVNGQSFYYGYAVTGTDTAIMNAAGQSDAYIFVEKYFKAEASGESKIYYKGNPVVKDIVATGASKIIPQ